MMAEKGVAFAEAATSLVSAPVDPVMLQGLTVATVKVHLKRREGYRDAEH